MESLLVNIAILYRQAVLCAANSLTRPIVFSNPPNCFGLVQASLYYKSSTLSLILQHCKDYLTIYCAMAEVRVARK
jgi:hypothetical protein